MISCAAGTLEVLELGLELVEGVLGEPDGAGVLGHAVYSYVVG